MANPLLSRVRRFRKLNKFKFFRQFVLSKTYARLCKCNPVDGLLAMVYPPGYLMHKHKSWFTNASFKMRCPKELGLEGLSLVKMKRKLMMRRKASGVKPVLTPLSKELQERVVTCMPHLTREKSLNLMDHEREKYGPHLKFLSLNTYPEFTVRMFEMYNFNRLLSFVVAELLTNPTPIWEFSYFKEDWIGIRLADLKTIAEKYPPISEVGSKSKLTFRLISSKVAEDQFFLYGVHVGVTKNGRLKRGGPASIVFKNETEIPSPKSIVLLSNVLEY